MGTIPKANFAKCEKPNPFNLSNFPDKTTIEFANKILMHALSATAATAATAYLLDPAKLHLNDLVCQAVLSRRGNVGHIAPSPRRQHDLVLDEGVLLHCGIDVPASQPVPCLHVTRTQMPEPFYLVLLMPLQLS